jgi:hypothetical protein
MVADLRNMNRELGDARAVAQDIASALVADLRPRDVPTDQQQQSPLPLRKWRRGRKARVQRTRSPRGICATGGFRSCR